MIEQAYRHPAYAGARKRHLRHIQQTRTDQKQYCPAPNEYHRGWFDGYDGEPARETGTLYLRGYADAVERHIRQFGEGPCCILVRPEDYRKEV